jgi:hypothetical protein
LHRRPRRRPWRGAGGLQRLLAAVARVEHRDPLAGAVVAEANLKAVARHAGDDVAEAAPVIEAAVQQVQLRRVRLEGEEAEGGGERGAAVGRVLHASSRAARPSAPIRLEVQYRPANDVEYRFVVATVLQVLTARPVALYLECVLTHTGLRADHAIRQIVALPLRVTEGRCDGCGEAGQVFARAAVGLPVSP